MQMTASTPQPRSAVHEARVVGQLPLNFDRCEHQEKMSDQLLGGGVLLGLGTSFVYYTLWTLVLVSLLSYTTAFHSLKTAFPASHCQGPSCSSLLPQSHLGGTTASFTHSNWLVSSSSGHWRQ